MRIIKSNTLRYEAFHKTLPSIQKAGTTAAVFGDRQFVGEEELPGVAGKGYDVLIKILSFIKNIRNISDRISLVDNLRDILTNLLNSKESNIFLFNEEQSSFEPISPNVSSRAKYFINNAFNSGTLNGIYNTGKHRIILDSLVYNIDGTKSFYLIVPFSGRIKNKGLLLVLLSHTLNENSSEINLIKICLEMLLSRLELITKKEELKKTYGELQLFRSKLSNDFKLSAIGELTTGIVEDILSPMQVIQSSTEFLRSDNSSKDDNVLDTINVQVKKVKNVISRLVNFANTGDIKNKIYPCSINNLINDFYLMFNSSLKNANYECVLDLENNIPPLLTNENYINQILTNIFHLIKAGNNKAGGILIQTRSMNEKVTVTFLSTDYFEELRTDSEDRMHDISLKIVKNIMLQHEGGIAYESDNSKGTIIKLSFPLKRKIVR